MTFVKTALFHKAGEGSGGGGGGDQHNLGWYATESALTTAHATATDGDWAIVGSTDTVWVWDSDTTAWVDTGAAGIELPDQTGQSGKFLTTDGSSASWSAISALQNTATGNHSLTILGQSSTEFYNINIGESSRCGTQNNTVIGYYAQTNTNTKYSVAVGAYTYGWENYCTAVGASANANKTGATSLGYRIGAENQNTNGTYTVGVGYNSQTQADYAIAIGAPAKVTARCAIQIGGSGTTSGYTNSDANTFKVGNANGNFEMMDANGNLPPARLATVPSAAGTYTLQATVDSDGNVTLAWV